MSAGEPDRNLVARAVEGDRRAYGLLVRRHQGALVQAARAFGIPETDIDDVVQEAFVAAWRRLVDYDAGRSFRAWLFRIAINKMRDLHRQRRVRRFLFGATDLHEERELLATDEPGPERHALAVADLARVQDMLGKLEREPREALVLTAIVGMSQPEAALALGTSIKSIEGRVARARRMLTTLLEQNS